MGIFSERAAGPKAILLIGPPGAGKSTWRRCYTATTGRSTVVLSSDDLIEAWGATHGLTYAQAFAQIDFSRIETGLHALLRLAISGESDILIDRTNMTREERAEFLNRLPARYRREAVIFSLPDRVLRERLAERMAQTGKFVPARVVDAKMAAFAPPTADEFDLIWVA